MANEEIKKASGEEQKKEGPKVLSKINLVDQFVNFEIKVGEIKALPFNYESSELITHCLKKKDLTLLNEQVKSNGNDKIPGITLDAKDVANFLNQNSRTVIKQLKINDLSKSDLNKLLGSERQGKARVKIINFIKTLKEVD